MNFLNLLTVLVNQNLFIHSNQYLAADPIICLIYLTAYYFDSSSNFDEHFIIISLSYRFLN